jgi:ribosomal protein S8
MDIRELSNLYESYASIYEMKSTGNLGCQDKETDMREHVLDYLVNEGYVDSYESAECVLEVMSDEWLESIAETKKAKIKVDVKRPIEWRIADIGANKKEYNIKTSKD